MHHYKNISLFISAYVACWFLGYVVINRDANLFLALEYFYQAWSLKGFVRPMYVWWLSNSLFIGIAILYLFFQRRSAHEA